MNATITYRLSEAGRKASIIAGGDGKRDQTILVPNDAIEFAFVLATGKVSDKGEVFLDTYVSNELSGYSAPEFDSPQTAASILGYYSALKESKARKEQEAAAERTAKTLAVLTERTLEPHAIDATITEDGITGRATYTYFTPKWPYGCDDAVVNSPEAQAWVLELERSKDAARAEADVQARIDLDEKKIKAAEELKARRERAAARLARVLELGGQDGDLLLKVEDGALAQVPSGCWESHKRGKNWLATISVDPSKPGGLDRSFQPKAKGDIYYLVGGLSAGDAVEFGADYYSGGGRKNPTRYYGFIVAIAGDALVLREAATGKAACKAAKAFQPLPAEDAVAAGLARINGEGSIVASNN